MTTDQRAPQQPPFLFRAPSQGLNVLLQAAFLLIAAFLISPQSPAQTRPIQLDDLPKITSVSDPQISPDGKSIAFVVSRVNLEQDRSDRQLVLVDIATGAQHILTYDRKGFGSPRWSPGARSHRCAGRGRCPPPASPSSRR